MAIRKIKAALVNTRDAPEYNTEIGYLFYDADPNGDLTLRISDGTTPGGIPITGAGGGISYARLNVVGDDSTGAVLNLGNATPDLQFAGTQNVSVNVDNTTGKVTITGPNLSSYLESGDEAFKIAGDDSTLRTVNIGESITIKGTGGITTTTDTEGNVTIDGSGVSGSGSGTLTIADDTSTTVDITTGEDTLKFAGAQNITTSISGDTLTITGPDLTSYIQSGDNISSLTNDAGYITSADVFELTVSDDSSTTSTLTKTDTLSIKGAQNITTALSGDTLTITGPDLSSYLTDTTLNVVADDSQTIAVNNGGTIQFSGGTNITTSTSSEGVVTIDGPSSVSQLTNDSGYITSAALNVVGDDSTGTVFDAANGDDIRFLGAGNVSVTVSGSTVIITGTGGDSSGGGGSYTYTQDSPPANPVDGESWLDTDSGGLYVYVVEGGYGQWIETGSAGATFDVDGIESIRFAADDSTSTPVRTSETLSILGSGHITTAVTGDGEIRISSTAPSMSTSDTAPSSPADGDLWWNTTTGSLYIYLNEDSTASANWVETAGSGSQGGGGITSVSADPVPTLGGNLNANTYNINNVSTISVATNGDPGTDPTTDSGVGYIYAKGATAELFVKDGAGNITQISPHSEEGDWVYYSENVKTGKRVKVNMERMIRKLEEITGETFFEIDEPHKINL